MMGGYAIVPDQPEQPTAHFTDLEDAIEWGLNTFGADAFRIRWLDVVFLAARHVGSA